MEKGANPAKWLWEITQRLPPSSTAATLQVWADVFSVPRGDPRVLTGLLSMIETAKRTSNLIRKIQMDNEPFMAQLLKWEPEKFGAIRVWNEPSNILLFC